MSGRQRDIFPIPTFDNISYDRHAVSHCTRKRLSRKNKVLAWANEGITVLNRVGSDSLSSSKIFWPEELDCSARVHESEVVLQNRLSFF